MTPFRASGATFSPAFDVIYLDRVPTSPYNARNENSDADRDTQYYYCSKGSDARMALEMGPSASVRAESDERELT
jgi:hypothetical protein